MDKQASIAPDPCWIPPRLSIDTDAQEGDSHEQHGEECKVTWLELLYDLVYVAMFIQLANWLSDNVTVAGFLRFVGLFTVIWWMWSGTTFYANRLIVDDVWHRLLVFIQIMPVAIMAISIDDAFGGLGPHFGLSRCLCHISLSVMVCSPSLCWVRHSSRLSRMQQVAL
ncbi:MAG: low temperature requirement protein A [Okeania sp. SIO3B3]|nr:low temperature requirement protein A [Okeania sp. SIO3B3]